MDFESPEPGIQVEIEMNVLRDTDPFVFETRDYFIFRIRSTDLMILPKEKHPEWKDLCTVAAVEDDNTVVNYYGGLDVPPRIQRQCEAYFRDTGVLRHEKMD